MQKRIPVNTWLLIALFSFCAHLSPNTSTAQFVSAPFEVGFQVRAELDTDQNLLGYRWEVTASGPRFINPLESFTVVDPNNRSYTAVAASISRGTMPEFPPALFSVDFVTAPDSLLVAEQLDDAVVGDWQLSLVRSDGQATVLTVSIAEGLTDRLPRSAFNIVSVPSPAEDAGSELRVPIDAVTTLRERRPSIGYRRTNVDNSRSVGLVSGQPERDGVIVVPGSSRLFTEEAIAEGLTLESHVALVGYYRDSSFETTGGRVLGATPTNILPNEVRLVTAYSVETDLGVYRFSAPVPEPTVSGWLIGAIALAGRKRRRVA